MLLPSSLAFLHGVRPISSTIINNLYQVLLGLSLIGDKSLRLSSHWELDGVLLPMLTPLLCNKLDDLKHFLF